jgi:hypothetical protein
LHSLPATPVFGAVAKLSMEDAITPSSSWKPSSSKCVWGIVMGEFHQNLAEKIFLPKHAVKGSDLWSYCNAVTYVLTKFNTIG